MVAKELCRQIAFILAGMLMASVALVSCLVYPAQADEPSDQEITIYWVDLGVNQWQVYRDRPDDNFGDNFTALSPADERGKILVLMDPSEPLSQADIAQKLESVIRARMKEGVKTFEIRTVQYVSLLGLGDKAKQAEAVVFTGKTLAALGNVKARLLKDGTQVTVNGICGSNCAHAATESIPLLSGANNPLDFVLFVDGWADKQATAATIVALDGRVAIVCTHGDAPASFDMIGNLWAVSGLKAEFPKITAFIVDSDPYGIHTYGVWYHLSSLRPGINLSVSEIRADGVKAAPQWFTSGQGFVSQLIPGKGQPSGSTPPAEEKQRVYPRIPQIPTIFIPGCPPFCPPRPSAGGAAVGPTETPSAGGAPDELLAPPTPILAGGAPDEPTETPSAGDAPDEPTETPRPGEVSVLVAPPPSAGDAPDGPTQTPPPGGGGALVAPAAGSVPGGSVGCPPFCPPTPIAGGLLPPMPPQRILPPGIQTGVGPGVSAGCPPFCAPPPATPLPIVAANSPFLLGDRNPLHPSLGGVDFSSVQLDYVSEVADAEAQTLAYVFKAERATQGAAPVKVEQAAKGAFDALFVWLALPSNTFWVNLNPGEPDRIIDRELGQTDAGRIMLEADFQMKKTVAGLLHPNSTAGKAFWDELYAEIVRKGTDRVCFSLRQWITPGKIVVSATDDTIYILEAALDVQAESDYLKAQSSAASSGCPADADPSVQAFAEKLFRERILPEVVKAVNTAPEYRDLRSIFRSRIVAEWYKTQHRKSATILAGVIDRGTAKEWYSSPPWDAKGLFDAYVKSVSEGEFNLTQKSQSTQGNTTIISTRTYFYGGVDFSSLQITSISLAQLQAEVAQVGLKVYDAVHTQAGYWDGPFAWFGGTYMVSLPRSQQSVATQVVTALATAPQATARPTTSIAATPVPTPRPAPPASPKPGSRLPCIGAILPLLAVPVWCGRQRNDR